MRRVGTALLVLAGLAALGRASAVAQNLAHAQSIGTYTPPPAVAAKVGENPPPRIAEFGTIANPVRLRPAAVDAREKLEAMEAWNRSGNEPPRAGFTRALPEAISARFDTTVNADSHSVRAAAGVTLWGTKVTVGDAHGIRLHLTGVVHPPGTKFWSNGTEGSPIEFGLELSGPDGDLWTPITFGETAFLDVEVPTSDGEGRFSILEIAEIRSLAATTEPPCAIDAACASSTDFPAIVEGRKAVALLEFMSGHGAGFCTGTLLNDTAQDGTPYLLTANHCISDQASASTLHALWDYDPPSCGGAVPALSSLQSSVGATLLATGATSDFCLMQLSSVPPGRSFLGWDARSSSLVPGTTIYRLSHPTSYLDVSHSPLPMEFAESLLNVPSEQCFAGQGADYFYSVISKGFEYYGSSGAAALLGSGEVVGQLKGSCDVTTQQFCAEQQQPPDLFDGAFTMTYPYVARWLDAPSPACVPDPTRLCLGSRFNVTAQWNKPDGTSGFGTAVSLTPDSGYFWFFDPSNVEIVTKVVGGCGINASYWVFASGLTNTGVTLTYVDLGSGEQQVYRSAAGTAFQPIQDTSAFATCP